MSEPEKPAAEGQPSQPQSTSGAQGESDRTAERPELQQKPPVGSSAGTPAEPAGPKPAPGPGEPQKPRPRPRRLTDDERKELWHRAVTEKARGLKLFSDCLIFLFLAIPLAAHVLTFVGPLRIASEWEPKRGYEVVLGLLTEGTRPYIHHKVSLDGTPMVDRATGRRLVEIQPQGPADVLAFAYLAVPFGAVLLVVLYLLDYFLWMGRVLPAISAVYGFGAVAYLVATRLPENGTWNALRQGSLLAWYLLLIPLFLLGTVSMLRFFVSHRWKRYEFAGLPVPEHLKPRPPAPPPAPAAPGENGPAGPAKPEPPKPPAAEAAPGERPGPREEGGKPAS